MSKPINPDFYTTSRAIEIINSFKQWLDDHPLYYDSTEEDKILRHEYYLSFQNLYHIYLDQIESRETRSQLEDAWQAAMTKL